MSAITKITPEIGAILKEGTSAGNVYFLPQVQLDRKVYVEANTALTNLGGKWNKKEKGHVFDSPPMEKIYAALESGETVNEKKRDNFFATPPELADRVVELAEIRKPDHILEPSAGNGALIKAALKKEHTVITAIDISQDRCKNLSKMGCEVICGDFLTLDLDWGYNKVIMNPPFNTEGRAQADIDHVLRAYKVIEDGGGRLVAIMSAGWVTRLNKKSADFRMMVKERGFYEDNDKEAFKESGTLIQTVTVVLNA